MFLVLSILALMFKALVLKNQLSIIKRKKRKKSNQMYSHFYFEGQNLKKNTNIKFGYLKLTENHF